MPPEDTMTATTAAEHAHDTSRRPTAEALALVGWIALSLSAGLVGQWLGGGMPDPWYQQLNKPPFTPPGWVFAPVWSTLFVLMGIAAWLVWRTNRSGRRLALALFCVQLIPNAAWSGLFFGLHRPGLALIDLGLLVILLAWTIGAFWRIRRLAAGLLGPYLAWCLFAALLNASIWRMNA
jgi:tryptophan-rich sensory protein